MGALHSVVAAGLFPDDGKGFRWPTSLEAPDLCRAPAVSKGMDDWLRMWTREAAVKDAERLGKGREFCSAVSHVTLRSLYCVCGNGTEPCFVPQYRPSSPHSPILWQTVRNVSQVGPVEHKCHISWLENAPSYNFLLFEDEDVDSFFCRPDIPPSLRHSYFSLRAGSARADLFRLTVLAQFGGLYADSDSMKVTPDPLLPQGATLVTAIQSHRPLSQFAVLQVASAGHPVIVRALRRAVERVQNFLRMQKPLRTVLLTGPYGFHEAAVEILLQEGCVEEELLADYLERARTQSSGFLPCLACVGGRSSLYAYSLSDPFEGKVQLKVRRMDGERRRWDSSPAFSPIHRTVLWRSQKPYFLLDGNFTTEFSNIDNSQVEAVCASFTDKQYLLNIH